jgi:GT2 family glycosyltransferase
MISVVIPHYKGKEKLYVNLKHNIPFLQGCEIIVVNDYPEVPLTSEMSELFPEVKVIENEKNLGFAGAVTVGISSVKNTFVFLLNNDVLLNDNSFQNAVSHFEKDKKLFAVSFRQTEKNGSFVGRNSIFWKNGFFQHSKADATKNGINGWAEGGSMLFDKNKYDTINGFDTLYSPFYWEDIDLSYRAWKAGYVILFDSTITVQHHHESTIATHFHASRIKTIAYRNQFITIWKNISDNGLIFEHLLHLMKNLITYPLRGEKEFVSGFWMAAQLSRSIMEKRDIQKKMWKKADREIFTLFK